MITLNGVPAEKYEIWSARFDLANGETMEVIYPDGEEAAREALDMAPGTLWMRQAYATAEKDPAHVEDAVEVPLDRELTETVHVGQLN